MVARLIFILGMLGVMTCGSFAADVRFKPVDPRGALCHAPRSIERMSATRGDVGRLSSTAWIGTMSVDGGKVHIAIDYLNRDTPQAVIFDFTGSGAFEDVEAVRVAKRRRGQNFWGEIAPSRLNVEHGGERYSIGVMGSVYCSQSSKSIDLYMGVKLQTRCVIDGKTYQVAIIDGDQNLRFGDRTRVRGSDVEIGDTLVLRGPRVSQSKVLFGQPVQIGDRWYQLAIDADHEITASPVDVETAQVQTGHRDWSAIFVGTEHVCGVRGSVRPITLPADTYRIARYEERMGRAMLSCRGLTDNTYEVTPGAVTRIEIGSPVQGKPIVYQHGREITISARLLDTSGLAVTELRLPGGGRPPAPRVAIFTERGRQLHAANLDYG